MRFLLWSAISAATLSLPFLAVLSRPVAAKSDEKSGAAFPFPVHEKTLANGLRVFVVGYDSPGLVAYYSIVRTGSRNEVEPTAKRATGNDEPVEESVDEMKKKMAALG